MSLEFTAGDTSKSIDVIVADDAGLPVAGLVAATFPEVVASRAGAYADTILSLSDLTLITDPWASGGLKERGDGVYRLDLPNSLLAAVATQKLRGEETDKRLLAETLTIKPASAGSGARSVTITVNDGSTALQNARVRMTNGAESYVLATNVSGVAVFAIDDATWTVTVTKAGYQFAPTTIVVNGTETATYSMTAVVITPSETDRTTCYVVVEDMAGDPAADVEVTFQYQRFAAGSVGEGVSVAGIDGTTDVNGLVEFVNIHRLADYRIRIGHGQWQTGRTLDASTTPLTYVIGP